MIPAEYKCTRDDSCSNYFTYYNNEKSIDKKEDIYFDKKTVLNFM